jgi:hypothetical protein
VAICAAYVALCDFRDDKFPRKREQTRNVVLLITPVVKLQNYWVALTAIDARMVLKKLVQPRSNSPPHLQQVAMEQLYGRSMTTLWHFHALGET